MPSYWPTDLELSDTAAPIDILLDASKEWKTNSQGLLELIMQSAQSRSGNDMILVHAKHVPSNRTASLFSVVMRPGNPYPARLQPMDEELPDFFKKTYSPERVGIQQAFNLLQNQNQNIVTNKWVAETPSEFREKLAEVFNLGVIKSIILNLIAIDTMPESKDDQLPTSDGSEIPFS